MSYLFKNHNNRSNVLLILENISYTYNNNTFFKKATRNHVNHLNTIKWNRLWCKYFYEKFFDKKYCIIMEGKFISFKSIPRIFINFDKVNYTSLFLDIK